MWNIVKNNIKEGSKKVKFRKQHPFSPKSPQNLAWQLLLLEGRENLICFQGNIRQYLLWMLGRLFLTFSSFLRGKRYSFALYLLPVKDCSSAYDRFKWKLAWIENYKWKGSFWLLFHVHFHFSPSLSHLCVIIENYKWHSLWVHIGFYPTGTK